MKKYTLLITIVILFNSCENEWDQEAYQTTSPVENFNYLWEKCLQEYSYFKVREIDWFLVKDKYESRIYESMSQDSLFSVLSEMLNELKDDHVNLFSNFRTSFYGKSLQVQDNFDWRTIVNNYLNSTYEITGPFQHSKINNNIAYVRLSAFTEEITANHLDYILQKYISTDGLVLDLRENGGGKIANVYRLLERFISTPTTVYFSRIKNGTGINDFSSPKPVLVKPFNGVRYEKPIVVLVDAGTFSSGSLFALATKAIPNITLIGQKTSGGLGMPKSGQLPNGWYYRFSITQTLDLDKNPDQENGVTPDVEVLMNWQDRNVDEVLEYAIEELSN